MLTLSQLGIGEPPEFLEPLNLPNLEPEVLLRQGSLGLLNFLCQWTAAD